MPAETEGQSWEAAVEWYRATATPAEVEANYFDLPVLSAAERFASSREFRKVEKILTKAPGRSLLDLGAGNGIASFAFARRGWQVESVEPDPSDLVGVGAIRRLAADNDLPIRVHPNMGEQLPLADGAVDAVHARQVLHHLADLDRGLAEMFRVLRPGGLAICTREHVVSDEDQLDAFLSQHPLHYRYGGESAYPLSTYTTAAQRAGFQIRRVIAPLESPINAYPMNENRRRLVWIKHLLRASAHRHSGSEPQSNPLRRIHRSAQLADATPGRLFSFVFYKP